MFKAFKTTVSALVYVKQQFIEFVDKENDVRKAIERMETFNKNKYFMISETFDDYNNGNKFKKSRLFWAHFIQVGCFLTIFKFILSALIVNPIIKVLTMDFVSILGKPNLIYSSLIIGLMSLYLICIFTQVSELQHKCAPMQLFHMLKTNSMNYPLNYTNSERFAIKMNILSRWIPYFICYPLVLILACAHIYLSIIIVLASSEISNFILLLVVVFWNGASFTLIVCLNASIGFAPLLGGGSILYLKYKFREINTKIDLSLKQRNIRLLFDAIDEHNYVERLTRDINFYSRVIFFICYYFITFSNQLILYVIFEEDSTPIGRSAAIIISVFCSGFIPLLTKLSTGVITEAHKSYPTLFTIINQKIPMTIQQRLKLCSFMEKLSGRQIGFYCYDLFPLNSYEFFQYLCRAGSNFLLIIGLFN